jgi:hypothetical protein
MVINRARMPTRKSIGYFVPNVYMTIKEQLYTTFSNKNGVLRRLAVLFVRDNALIRAKNTTTTDVQFVWTRFDGDDCFKDFRLVWPCRVFHGKERIDPVILEEFLRRSTFTSFWVTQLGVNGCRMS